MLMKRYRHGYQAAWHPMKLALSEALFVSSSDLLLLLLPALAAPPPSAARSVPRSVPAGSFCSRVSSPALVPLRRASSRALAPFVALLARQNQRLLQIERQNQLLSSKSSTKSSVACLQIAFLCPL
jgi:hypothetical protein